MISFPKKIQNKMELKFRETSKIQNKYIKEYIYVVVLTVLFCAMISLLSYAPSDPSSFNHLSDTSQKISNYFGPMGALFADWTFQIFGFGAIIFLIIFIVQILYIFRKPFIEQNLYLKFFGYLQFILFYLGFASGIKPLISFKGIELLTGGLIGEQIFNFLHSFFGYAGSLTILFMGGFASLTICIGIKPISSILWFLKRAPHKNVSELMQDIEKDPDLLLDDLHDAKMQSESSMIVSRTNQNVFHELISCLTQSELSFKSILQSEAFQNFEHILPIACGHNESGEPFVIDLSTLPNLFIEGAEGIDKQKFLNNILLSLFLNKSPTDLRVIIIDPQMLDLQRYKDVAYLLMPIITSAHRSLSAFEFLKDEIEKRSTILKNKKINDYRQLGKTAPFPPIVVLITELKELMLSIPYEIEANLKKVASRAQAVGIYLICATQDSNDMLIASVQPFFSKKLNIFNNTGVYKDQHEMQNVKIHIPEISPQEVHNLSNILRSLYPFSQEAINS